MATEIISRKQASAQGLKRYFTGVPCKRGHTADRIVLRASCSICDYEKDRRWKEANRSRIRELENARKAKPGEARERRLARRAEWRQENKERLLLAEAEQRTANPDHRRKISRRYYWKDPDKGRARAKKWREENLDKRQKYLDAVGRQKEKKWRAAHKAELKTYYASWQKENKGRVYASIHKRRALKKNSGGSHTAAEVAAILKAQKHRCANPGCGADLRKVGKHLDHIMPLALGGSNDRWNLQFLCPTHNLSKGARDPIVFARQQGRLL